MSYASIKTKLSTINFVLPFIGYQLITSCFLPVVSDVQNMNTVTRIVTIPYRAVALTLTILVLFLHGKSKIIKSTPLFLLFLFWMALLIRMFYDLEIRSDISINVAQKNQVWLYSIFICSATIISIAKSFKSIDFELAFKLILVGYVTTTFILLFSNPLLLAASENIGSRINGNVGLNTIGLGHLSASLLICIFYALRYNTYTKYRYYLYVISILSFIVLLRAGSRGPIISTIGVFIFYYFARQKNILWGIIISILVLCCGYIFMDKILDWIGFISPVLESRLNSSIYNGDTSNRIELYNTAIDSFTNSPLIGGGFAIFKNDSSFIYSHNMILDAFMGLGIFGGILFLIIYAYAIKECYILIHRHEYLWWTSLLLIQQIIAGMTSGAFYMSDLLSILLTLNFINYKHSQLKSTYVNQDKSKKIVPINQLNQYYH